MKCRQSTPLYYCYLVEMKCSDNVVHTTEYTYIHMQYIHTYIYMHAYHLPTFSATHSDVDGIHLSSLEGTLLGLDR